MLKVLQKLQLLVVLCLIFLSYIQSFFVGYRSLKFITPRTQTASGSNQRLYVVTTGPFINSENHPTYVRESSHDQEHLVCNS